MANILNKPTEETFEQQVEELKKMNQSLSLIAGSNTIKEFGLKWNQTTDSYTRLGDAVGLSVDTTSNTHISDFDAFYPWSDMKLCNLADNVMVSAYYGTSNFAFDGSNGQVMVEIPKFYVKIRRYVDTSGNNIIEYWVSNANLEGYELHPSFIEGGVELDEIYIAAKEAYNNGGILESKSGVQPTTDQTIGTFRTQAEARGTGWHLYDKNHFLVYLLMAIEYADLNMQRALSEGITNLDSGTGNHSQNTGHTDGIGDGSGEAVLTTLENGATGATETYPFCYRGIENVYGNVWKFLDGLILKDDGYYIGQDITNYNETGSGYTHISQDLTVGYGDGYIDDFEYLPNMKYTFFANSTNGSSSTYPGDYFYEHDVGDVNIVRAGGLWTYGSIAGAAYLRCAGVASASDRAVGARLCAKKI